MQNNGDIGIASGTLETPGSNVEGITVITRGYVPCAGSYISSPWLVSQFKLTIISPKTTLSDHLPTNKIRQLYLQRKHYTMSAHKQA